MIWYQIVLNSLPLERTDASKMPEAGVSCSERLQISSFFGRFVPWLLALVCPFSSLLPPEPTLPAPAAVSRTLQRCPRNALVRGTLCLVLLGGFSKVRDHLRMLCIYKTLLAHYQPEVSQSAHRAYQLPSPNPPAVIPALGWTRGKSISHVSGKSFS